MAIANTIEKLNEQSWLRNSSSVSWLTAVTGAIRIKGKAGY